MVKNYWIRKLQSGREMDQGNTWIHADSTTTKNVTEVYN